MTSLRAWRFGGPPKPWRRRKSVAVFAAWLVMAGTALAQALPSEPISIAGGRLVLGGDVAVPVAPSDPGYFNYTDYEHNTLLRTDNFDRPGIVRVFCDIHSHMSAFVLMFGHRYFALTDTDGTYRIDNVPPGTYNVAAWHEGDVRDTRTLVIPGQGGVVEQNFEVQ